MLFGVKTLLFLVRKRYFLLLKIWCENDNIWCENDISSLWFCSLESICPNFFSYNKYGFTWPPPPPFNAMSPISVFFLWSIPNLRNRNVEIMIMKTTNLLEQCTAVSSKHQSWLLLLLGLFSCLCLWSLFIVKMIKMTEKLQTTSWENSPQLQFWTKSKKEKNR